MAVWRGLLFDLIYLLLLVLTVGPALAGTAWAVETVPLPAWAKWLAAPVWAVAFLLLLAACLGVLRLLTPRLKPGRYAFPGDKQAVVWLVHFALQRIGNHPLWHATVMSFASLRYLMLRALGARIAFALDTSSDASVIDPSLTTIGPGSMLAASTLVAGHFIEHGFLLLAPVTLGAGVQVLGAAAVGPGARVGDHTVIGPGTKVMPHAVIGPDVMIGLDCVIGPEVEIGESATIGPQVTLEHKVQVGAHARVLPRTIVPRGTVIPEDTTYPA